MYKLDFALNRCDNFFSYLNNASIHLKGAWINGKGNLYD